MRALLVLLCAFCVSSCGSTPLPRLNFQAPKTFKFTAKMFVCDTDPPPWPEGAADPEIAANIREGRAAGKDCRQQLYRACLTADAAGQLDTPGSCVDPYPKKKPPAQAGG